MKDLQLSEHFSLREFERSATADKFHINNTVPSQYSPTLQQLCQEVLEPLRRFVGGPIVISSGYRCNALNVKVGGAYATQHTLGEAADISLPLTSYTAWDNNKRRTSKSQPSPNCPINSRIASPSGDTVIIPATWASGFEGTYQYL